MVEVFWWFIQDITFVLSIERKGLDKCFKEKLT
jgi:hypothetical protein